MKIKAEIKARGIIRLPGRQKGLLTLFSGVLILVMLTLMMFFATRVSVFEQRVSSDDMLQKLAFHTAESGIHHAKEYFLANSVYIARPWEDITPDGRDGWLSTGNERWQPCSGEGLDLASGSGSHPCFGEPNPAIRSNLYFYEFDGSREVPVDTDTIRDDGETVAVEALLCVMVMDFEADTPVQGCSTDTSLVDGQHFMLTLLARSGVECAGGDCNGEALIREQVSNFGGTAGGNAPSVPLTTRTSFPPSGTAEIVPNPNSGGIGVPISVWMNANTSCSANSTVVDPSSGSWSTCEMHEWYGIDAMPEGVACTGTCSCSRDEAISYTHGTEDTIGIDMVADADFPCDLFQFFFGVPSSEYEIVKGFSQVISDCSSLNENSFGIYWVSGAECRVNSNTQVGSPEAPVLLVSAASLTRFNGGAELFGILFLTDTEDPDAELDVNGNNTIYGSVISDSKLASYTGTFQIVYNENVIGLAAGGGGLGSVIGGWSDFHPDWN